MSIKSELTKTASYLRSARNAIAGRGGEISATAGLKDLPMAIFNIPADSSLGFYSDNTVAYKKTTLANAKEKILLNEIGGMTYKSENLLNPAFFDATKEIASGLTITNNGDGSLVINGAGEVAAYQTEYNVLPLDSPRIYGEGVYLSIDKPLPENMAILVWTYATSDPNDYSGESFNWLEGDMTSIALYNWIGAIFITGSPSSASGGSVSADNLTIKPMLSRGSVKPFEPYFEGLRDSKVTALKVYGANLLRYPYFHGTTTINGVTFTDNGDGTVTANGTATARALFRCHVSNRFNLPKGAYTLSGCPSGGSLSTYYINCDFYNKSTWVMGIADKGESASKDASNKTYTGVSCDIVIMQGTVCNNLLFKPMINLGTKAAPQYFPYKAEPTTYALPEAVQALDGYGEGFYTVYNQIRQNRITFDGVGAATYTKSCYRLILNGSEDWVVSTSKANTFVLHWGVTTEFGYTSEYEPFKSYDLAGTTNGIYMSNSSFAYITDKRYTTVEEFKAHLAEKPLIVLYSTTTPEVTDISAELGNFDPFIYVEPTGEIEFVNEYENAVPSKITYIVKAGS